MRNMLDNVKLYGLLAITVPVLAGCSGGSAFTGTGSLFGFLGSNGGSIAQSFTDPDLLSNIGTNPEPASMLLMGSGMAAMAYFKTKKK